MKAVQISGGKPQVVERPIGDSEGVRIKVVSSSICGSDLHLLQLDMLEGRTPGHEFAGIAPNGQAVAIEPVKACGRCMYCNDGYLSHCEQGVEHIGVSLDGGMAEYAVVPESSLVPLPSGMDIQNACLVEPLAIALHGFDRITTASPARCLIIGAGPIGLAAIAAAQARGMQCDVIARHEHQAAAAERLGARSGSQGHYSLIVDAVGNSETLHQACELAAPLAQIIFLGTAWDGTAISFLLQMKEISLLAATGYRCSGERSFVEAARVLHQRPMLAETLISHRFPLEAAEEAFATAANRAAGALKVAFAMPA